jgi:DNA-binding transcriptional MerR regulator
MRGIGRRLRSTFGIGSSRMAIRSQLAWYWRWMLNILMMVVVGGVVWWLVQNSYRITGFNIEEVRAQIASMGEENRNLKRDLDAAKGTLSERDRQLQIEKAAQGELARSVAQLQEENAALKEDLGFLRNIMSSTGATPEGLGVSNLKVERDGKANEYRYRMLLTQGGQRKQDFKGKVQIVARVAKDGTVSTVVFPDPSAGEAAGAFEFRFYHKVEGRFAIPDGTSLKGVDVRVLALPGGQVKLSRTLNQL